MKRFTTRVKDGIVILDCASCSMFLATDCFTYTCKHKLKERLCALEDAVEKLDKQLEAKEQSLAASVNHYYREGIQDARKLLADALAETKNGGN